MSKQDRLVRIARYVLPAAIVLFVLWAGYQAATHRRYENINGVPGELLAGESLGQSFVARYDGLAGVEVRIATYGHATDTARSTLVLRLRASPDSHEDIATVTLPPDFALKANDWYLFRFAPIANSRGKPYFLLVEAPNGAPGTSMSLFWFQPPTTGDPYGEGSAYRNGQITRGDLAFGLQYAAPPLQVWGSMLSEAGESTSPILVWGLLVIAAIGIFLFVARPAQAQAEEGSRRAKAWPLALALGVWVVHGLLFMAVTPPWQGPDEYAHYAYAALLDRHDLDDGKVEALDLGGKDRDVALIRAVNASADRNDFMRRLRGNSNQGGPTRTDASLFQQVRQPPTYYWLCALALRAARLVGIPADPYVNPDVSLYVMRSVSLGLGLVVIALAYLALGLRVAITIALLPMHTFISTVINNDILAEVAVSALFVAVMSLLKTTFERREGGGLSKRELILAGVCVLLTIAGLGTKATAPAAGMPLLAGGLALWLAARITRRIRATMPRLVKRAGLRLLVVILLSSLVGVGAFIAIFEQREDQSVGWFTGYAPLLGAQRVATDSAHDGRHVIQLEATQEARAVQRLIPRHIYHPALRVTLAGWVRLEPGQAAQATGQVAGELAVMDGVREAGFAFTTLGLGGGWSRLEVAGDLEANAEEIQLRIGVRDGSMPGAKVQFDDLSLRVEAIDAPWNNPIYRAALVDPSGEQGRWALRPFIEDVVPGEASDMASALLNPQPFSKAALWADYAAVQYKSFWGSFGWLSIELPLVAYLAIGGLIILAAVGLAMHIIEAHEYRWGWRDWLAAISIVSLAVAIAISFAKQTALTAYGGLPSAPQGRYLFVLTIPIVWLLLEGLRSLLIRLWPQAASRSKLVLSNLLLLFALYSLLALVVPYFYG
ncbi:MAG: DUF2142 domain-containing protein [Chloroflexia bacterium]